MPTSATRLPPLRELLLCLRPFREHRICSVEGDKLYILCHRPCNQRHCNFNIPSHLSRAPPGMWLCIWWKQVICGGSPASKEGSHGVSLDVAALTRWTRTSWRPRVPSSGKLWARHWGVHWTLVIEFVELQNCRWTWFWSKWNLRPEVWSFLPGKGVKRLSLVRIKLSLVLIGQGWWLFLLMPVFGWLNHPYCPLLAAEKIFSFPISLGSAGRHPSNSCSKWDSPDGWHHPVRSYFSGPKMTADRNSVQCEWISP